MNKIVSQISDRIGWSIKHSNDETQFIILDDAYAD